MIMGYKVAIVGATGNVGREMLDILAERAFPVSEVVALASQRSVGQEVSFGDKSIKTKVLDHLPDVSRRLRFEGLVAAHRRARLRRDR
jgi:aspartate-semialdehyde dehydrogenase